VKNKENITMDEVRSRKESLKQEIRLLEGDFERRVKVLKSNVNEIRKPSKVIRKSPLKSVAIAVGAGFAAGLLKRKRRSGKTEDSTPSGKSSGLTTFIIHELQHLAAQKAMLYLSDLIDRQISGLKKRPDSDQ
jgi:ElaB/YqjD/DUF883 family membrane-anchored ribosome-binding protein